MSDLGSVEPSADASAAAGEPEIEADGDTGRSRRNWWRIGAWAALCLFVAALDGWVGLTAAVVVASVMVARLPLRVIGGLGVGALFAALVAVLVDGLPSEAEVSPAFVSRSLWPHHLMFIGLVLVSAWAIIDLFEHFSRRPAATVAQGPSEPPLGLRLGVVIVVLVAFGALWACSAVLGA